MEASFPAIRHQLTAVLHEWHPSDPSAVAVLRPWAGVFHPRDWAALVHRSIMPKLAYALDAMAVNPASQDLAPVEWALQVTLACRGTLDVAWVMVWRVRGWWVRGWGWWWREVRSG